MPNILQMQEILKSVPDQRLMQEMQQPTGRAPQFLVMTELQRRQKVRDEYQGRVQEEQTTVAEDMVRSAAPQQVPMPSGGMASLAPQPPMQPQAGPAPMGMAQGRSPIRAEGGGALYMQAGSTAAVNFGAADLDRLIKLVEAEAGNQDDAGKRGVAAVILNRLMSNQFPNTIEGVTEQRLPTGRGYQFSPLANVGGDIDKLPEGGAGTRSVVLDLLSDFNEKNPIGDALYFQNTEISDAVFPALRGYFDSEGKRNNVPFESGVTKLGDHVFSETYASEDKPGLERVAFTVDENALSTADKGRLGTDETLKLIGAGQLVSPSAQVTEEVSAGGDEFAAAKERLAQLHKAADTSVAPLAAPVVSPPPPVPAVPRKDSYTRTAEHVQMLKDLGSVGAVGEPGETLAAPPEVAEQSDWMERIARAIMPKQLPSTVVPTAEVPGGSLSDTAAYSYGSVNPMVPPPPPTEADQQIAEMVSQRQAMLPPPVDAELAAFAQSTDDPAGIDIPLTETFVPPNQINPITDTERWLAARDRLQSELEAIGGPSGRAASADVRALEPTVKETLASFLPSPTKKRAELLVENRQSSDFSPAVFDAATDKSQIATLEQHADDLQPSLVLPEPLSAKEQDVVDRLMLAKNYETPPAPSPLDPGGASIISAAASGDDSGVELKSDAGNLAIGQRHPALAPPVPGQGGSLPSLSGAGGVKDLMAQIAAGRDDAKAMGLLTAGLGIMQQASQPGATLLSSIPGAAAGVKQYSADKANLAKQQMALATLANQQEATRIAAQRAAKPDAYERFERDTLADLRKSPNKEKYFYANGDLKPNVRGDIRAKWNKLTNPYAAQKSLMTGFNEWKSDNLLKIKTKDDAYRKLQTAAEKEAYLRRKYAEEYRALSKVLGASATSGAGVPTIPLNQIITPPSPTG